eukprot:scaffold693_cov200-Alexandrium_tamarense.AAC.107
MTLAACIRDAMRSKRAEGGGAQKMTTCVFSAEGDAGCSWQRRRWWTWRWRWRVRCVGKARGG